MSGAGSSFSKKGLFGKDSTGSADVYLNLTPLLDVMSNILFFLLSAFGATIVAAINVTIPVQSDTESSVSAEEEKVTVTLRVDAQGFSVKCEGDAIARDQLAAYAAKMPKKGTDYDIATLTAHLIRIKEKWPASATIIVVPDEDLKYDKVVEILDAARDAPGAGGVGKRLLFPDVVLSALYKGDPEEDKKGK